MHCAVNIPAEKNNKWYRAVVSALDGSAVQVVGSVLIKYWMKPGNRTSGLSP